MKYLQRIEAKKIVFTEDQDKGYTFETLHCANMFCDMLRLLYPGADFQPFAERMQGVGATGWFTIGCISWKLAKAKHFNRIRSFGKRSTATAY